MSVSMKPIETKYRGYRFRSRLEARWAVFFDTLGLEWDYELQGFDLGPAGWYLPDFRVVYPEGGDVWFEVKASLATVPVDEWPKLRAFEDAVEPKLFLVLDGTPDSRLYLPPSIARNERLRDRNPNSREGWALWSHKARPWWEEPLWCFGYGDFPGFAPDILFEAIERARSARFEHGEAP